MPFWLSRGAKGEGDQAIKDSLDHWSREISFISSSLQS